VAIGELGYVVVETPDLEAWRTFATQILGMRAESGPDGSLYLKMDDRDFRFALVPGTADRLQASGWGVATQKEYDALRDRLNQADIQIQGATPQESEARKVQDFFAFTDPEGGRHEVFWGPVGAFESFFSPIGVSGFVTGDMGLGHVVLPAANFDRTQKFWTEVMGFGLSDILHMQVGPGAKTRFHFLHCGNGRQHSLAFGEMPSKTGCLHVMLEMASLDDVGKAMDRVQAGEVPVLMTLGRHVNDDMISFYVIGPGGFIFEIGWGGAIKQWERHTVFETTRPSHWGHHLVRHDLL
jgi:3,4-dihydroxy-9,10-secoandrosta-1,3,5(10)-triene-9,17-dione 4,5-dioxygenase